MTLLVQVFIIYAIWVQWVAALKWWFCRVWSLYYYASLWRPFDGNDRSGKRPKNKFNLAVKCLHFAGSNIGFIIQLVFQKVENWKFRNQDQNSEMLLSNWNQVLFPWLCLSRNEAYEWDRRDRWTMTQRTKKVMLLKYEIKSLCVDLLSRLSSLVYGRYQVSAKEQSYPYEVINERILRRSLKHRYNFRPQITVALCLETVMHAIQLTIGYILMLLFMTFNVWICIAVVLGEVIGRFIFSAFFSPPEMTNPQVSHIYY